MAKKEPTTVTLSFGVSLNEIVDSINGSWLLDQDEIMKFILRLDEDVCDYDFTKKLWKRLKKITDNEDKASKRGML